MNEDIETIEKHENSKQRFQKTKRRTIHEVIDKDYIENSNIFPDVFYQKTYIMSKRTTKHIE